MKLHPALKVGLGAALATSALGAIVGLVFAQQKPGNRLDDLQTLDDCRYCHRALSGHRAHYSTQQCRW